MVSSEHYNQLIGKLVSSIEESHIIEKTDKIVCCTNGNSKIVDELIDRGYSPVEQRVVDFDGKNIDVLITFLNYSDFIKISPKVDHRTRVISLYRTLLASSDPKQQKIIDSFFVNMVGEGISVDEDIGGQIVSTPFDNRAFIYDFSGGAS